MVWTPLAVFSLAAASAGSQAQPGAEVPSAIPSAIPLATAPCAPAASPGRPVRLRGHDYTPIGDCGGVPVLRTPSTDSTFLDRGDADGPVILVTVESVDPASSDGGWPAPPGNLYLSVVVPGPVEAARGRLSAALAAWRAENTPGVSWTEAWDGMYGAHRAEDRRFVTGLVLQERPEGVAIGLDLHLHARQAHYAALGKAGEHVTLGELASGVPTPEAALWPLLNRLVRAAEAPAE